VVYIKHKRSDEDPLIAQSGPGVVWGEHEHKVLRTRSAPLCQAGKRHHLNSDGFSLRLPARSWNNTWGSIDSCCTFSYPTATQTSVGTGKDCASTYSLHKSNAVRESHALIAPLQDLACRNTGRIDVWTT